MRVSPLYSIIYGERCPYRFAWFVLLEGGREANGRHHGLRRPSVWVLARMDGHCREVGEMSVFRLLGHGYVDLVVSVRPTPTYSSLTVCHLISYM